VALQALHEIFWPGDGVGPAPPPPGQGYTNAAVIGCFVPYVPLSRRTRKVILQRWNAVLRWVPERIWLLWRLYKLVYSPDYTRAMDAVRLVARTPGMREQKMWGEIGQRLYVVPGARENFYRRLKAEELYGTYQHRKRHEMNTALEIAYLTLKERGY
jgi:hypothetical protein